MHPIVLTVAGLLAPAAALAQDAATSVDSKTVTATTTQTYEVKVPPLPPLPTVALSPTDAPRVRAMMIDGIALLLADKPADATRRFRDILALAASRADQDELASGPDGAARVQRRWDEAKRRTNSEARFDQSVHWAMLAAAYDLSSADDLPSGARTDTPTLATLVLALARKGTAQELAALLAPIFDAADAQDELALAKRLSASPRSEQELDLLLALFDRPERRTPDAVRKFHRERATLRYNAGDLEGATLALERSRRAGEPLDDLSIAILFEQGKSAEAMAAIKTAAGQQPQDRILSRAAIGRLMQITQLHGGKDRYPIAIYRLALESLSAPEFVAAVGMPLQDTFPVMSGGALTVLSVRQTKLWLANALLAEGYAAEAEPLLQQAVDASGIGPTSLSVSLQWGEALEALARFEQAELLYRRLSATCDEDRCPFSRTYRIDQSIVRVLLAREKYEEAEVYAAKAVERPRTDDPFAHVHIVYLRLYTGVLEARGKLDQAERVLREAIALDTAPDRSTISETANAPAEDARVQLATLLERSGRAAEAEPIRRRILSAVIAETSNRAEGALRRRSALALARNLALQGQVEGVRLFQLRMAQVDAAFGTATPQLLEVAESYARTMIEARQPVQALAPARRALAVRTSTRFLSGDAVSSSAGRLQTQRLSGAARLVVQAAWGSAVQR